MTDGDREQFEQEINHLKDEINRVVHTTEYNTKNLFLDRYEEKFTAESSINVSDPIARTEKILDLNALLDPYPEYSPDGTKIAYQASDGDYELYVYDIPSGVTTRLTNDAHTQYNAQWSPDGEYLYYGFQDGGTAQYSIKKMQVSTQTTTDVTAPGAFDSLKTPTVSADGSTILFDAFDPAAGFPVPQASPAPGTPMDRVPGLWVASATKTDQTAASTSTYRLTGTLDTLLDASLAPWNAKTTVLSSPGISPAGDRAVFSLWNVTDGQYNVYSGEITSDLTDFRDLLTKLVTATSSVWTPKWSDDNYLLYSQNDGADYEINIMKVNSNGQQVEAPIKITDNVGATDVSASFHPEGRKILYSSNAEGLYDIYEDTLNINRTQTINLVTIPSEIDLQVTVNGTELANDPYDGSVINENMVFFYGDSAPVDGDVIEVKYHPKDVEMVLQVGYEGQDRIDVSLPTALDTERLGIDGISVLHADTAEDALSDIDAAIELISEERGELGAQQSRLERTAQELASRREYLQRSESRVRDADMAIESMFMVRDQILQQSSTQIMVQANNMAQSVLNLLNV